MIQFFKKYYFVFFAIIISLFFNSSYFFNGILEVTSLNDFAELIFAVAYYPAFSIIFLNIFSATFTPLRVVRNIILIIVTQLYVAINLYYLKNRVNLDYSVLADNFGLAFSKESFLVIFNNVDYKYFIVFSLMAIIALFYQSKWHIRSSSVIRRILVSAVSLIILIFPVGKNDPVYLFAFSINDYYSKSDHSIINEKYPYIKERVSTSIETAQYAMGKNKPNVIIILIESFNANFVKTLNENNVEYTPYFNRLIEKGLYVERFYGNSIQTSKGQAAVLLSIIPSYKGKIFTDYQHVSFNALPEILSNNGYYTLFYQAYHDLKFDNTGNFMRKIGFQEVLSLKDYIVDENMIHFNGWGFQDDFFYTKFFEYIDNDYSESVKPLFAVLSTVGTHIPCDGLSTAKQKLYKNPIELKEKYANALNLADSNLKIFFDELDKREGLKNTIVIITSDHSFPMKEHGFYNNEIGFYDESFRIPFLLIWNAKIRPEKIERVYSQIDIAPTIMDLLGLYKTKNHFQGISIFAKYPENHSTYLVQPYNGRFLGVYKNNLKFIKRLSTGKEYLFNLKDDPGEKTNLIENFDPVIVQQLRSDLDTIHKNQQSLENNLFWDK